MDFLKKISKLIRGINSGVRIEEPKPFQKKYEVNSPTVWFTDSDIEQCLNAVAKLKIKHIHLQTTSTLEFLKDQRLQTVKGIDIQYPQKDIEPLLGLSRLTHLGLPDDIKGTFDFNLFPNLIYLAGQLPKKYVNFECLKNLRHAYLFGYRKKDFSDFSQFTNLKTLEIISANIVDLKGISKLSSLSELILNKCPKLESLDGLSKEQGSLNKIMIENTKRLKDISP